MFIYKITNIINKKIYIGYNSSTKDTRWNEHKRDYLKEKFKTKNLYKAMIKYGIENFSYEKIEEGIEDLDTLKNREIFWISYYDSNNPCLGYNMTKGGDGGCGNITFLKRASSEELEIYGKKISSSKKKFFTKEKKEEWSKRSKDLNLSQYMIKHARSSLKKWWESLSEKEKFEIQSKKSTGWWDKLSKERQEELSRKRSISSKKYFENMPEDEKIKRINNQRNKISRTCKITSPNGEVIITNRLRETSKIIGVSYNTLNISIKENRPVKNGWICEVINGNT
jgi:group I intron endonuclease